MRARVHRLALADIDTYSPTQALTQAVARSVSRQTTGAAHVCTCVWKVAAQPYACVHLPEGGGQGGPCK
eukprot:10137509-Alexandrium_andersonii.AAC.2